MSPLARLEVTYVDQAVVASVEGDVDLTNAQDLHMALESAVRPDAVGVVADLSAVTYLDSSGVAALVRLARGLLERRQRLAIVAPAGGAVRRVLEIVGIDTLASLHASPDDAAAALGDYGA